MARIGSAPRAISSRHKIDVKRQAARRPFEHRLIVRETPFKLPESDVEPGIQAIYRALVQDSARDACIVEDVAEALGQGRVPILLTERKDHLSGSWNSSASMSPRSSCSTAA